MRLWVDIGISYCVHHEEMQALFSLNSIGATVWILCIKDLMMKTVYHCFWRVSIGLSIPNLLWLRLFWLQTTSGNAFLEKWVFACYWKLVQIENVFSVDYKIRAMGCKIFSVVIFTSNHFRRRAKGERGRERRTHRRAQRERERAPSNPRSRWSDRRPRPFHAMVSALFIQAPPRSHINTPALARSIHIQELRSLLHELQSTSMSSNPSFMSSDPSTSMSFDPSSMSSDSHDPPMPNLSLSRSTSPFPSLVDHSLFLLFSVWPSFWC